MVQVKTAPNQYLRCRLSLGKMVQTTMALIGEQVRTFDRGVLLTNGISGWGWNTPTDNLVTAWDNTDPRKAATILYPGNLMEVRQQVVMEQLYLRIIPVLLLIRNTGTRKFIQILKCVNIPVR